ncbi:mucoidy inhibitor MuiA family protein [Chamaesiphon sp. VAR_48_metabat_403]|uniref:mucoidy inhibitor MuiA family protein n=1 Tax=Chamaesiphon sp. VAR_48_metabat_403 TaxID=2964700 RepID=UPI00286E9C7A|nr:mucoidy inhibitor MuiA family protein [Chamaesiphon sp. VAR_48_metabat_403]
MISTEIQTLDLNAPVTTVTLLEDRAQIQRMTKVSLTAGLWRVHVVKVAPILSDKSLRAEFNNRPSGARVNDVRVRRRMLIKESDRSGLFEELKTQWRSQFDRYNILTEDRQQLEDQFQQIGIILAKALAELPIDAAWGQVDPLAWRSQLQPLFQKMREARSEILSTYHAQEQLQSAIERLVNRIQAESRPDRIFIAQIEADLEIAETGEYELAFDYVAPNAFWRPYHQAQLQMGENSQLTFRTDGCVWQNTGEDWLNVDLVFSTARASLGTEPPLLTDDLLNIREKAKKIAVEMRDQTVKTTGLGAVTRPDTIDLPGVDDGGEVRTLRAPKKANIPSDGHPYRVPLFQFQSSAEIEHILMPEMALEVVLKSEQTNNATFPILAGPVDLVKSTEYVGRTTVSFIAPQEKFALGWGTDVNMRVQRTQREKREQNHLTQWNTITNTVSIFLSNIGDETRKITMTERVPVSELEKVKIEVVQDETSDSLKERLGQRIQPDLNGFCNWNLQIPAYSQAKVILVYKIAAAPDVEGL